MQAVCFDLVGTLVRGRRPIGQQYADHLGRFGIAAEASRLDAAFGRAMRAAPPMAFPGRSVEEARALEHAWWRQVVRRVLAGAGLAPMDGPSFDAFFTSLFDHFTTGRAWELYPDVLPTLAALRARGLALGLITNYDTRVFTLLEALGLAPWLDAVTIPAHVGAAKPDPAIFRHAVAQLGVSPGEALHVGDELEDDYRGARAAGLDAVLLDRSDRPLAPGGPRRIGTLADLVTGPESPGGTR
jgi:putative hydrolase of the HAD superfamily